MTLFAAILYSLCSTPFFYNKHQVNSAQPQICLKLNNRPYCYKTIDLLFFSQHPSLNMLIAFMLIKKVNRKLTKTRKNQRKKQIKFEKVVYFLSCLLNLLCQ